MARTVNNLSAVQVTKLIRPGTYGDGGGLYLQVAERKAGGVTKSWLFRFMISGKARYMGLGSLNDFTLKEARERARAQRQMLADGKDPITERNEHRKRLQEEQSSRDAEQAKRVTFAQASQRYIKAHEAGWRNAKHADQWTNTLATYADPVIGHLAVSKVDTAHVMQILEPIWTTKPETASRVRGRVEAVLNWASARRYRSGENPARWKGHLDKLLPARSKVRKVKHYAAMAFAELPDFMGRLSGNASISARALEFTILTAVRTSEAIGATETEFDRTTRVWTIPGERTKSGRPHRVPLSDRAMAVLAAVPHEDASPFLFPGARPGKALSNMAMLELLRGEQAGLTVHGFRSTFRDWAAECTNFPRELAEAALAHVVGDETERAYRRGDALEKRRKLMQAWGRFVTTLKPTNTAFQSSPFAPLPSRL